MDLKQAQELVWLHQNPPPGTTREALGRLQKSVAHTVECFEADRLASAQTGLEEVLLQVLLAMKSLGIDGQQALERALNRLQHSERKRIFHIFADHVEIRVDGEHRGEWLLYGEADYDAALQLARELQCDVIHEEACQLELFSP